MGKKKASTRAGLKNTGSNVSNVVPFTAEPLSVAFCERQTNDNGYHYHLQNNLLRIFLITTLMLCPYHSGKGSAILRQ